MKSVAASFGRGSAKYHYLVLDGDDPEVGDLVLTSVTFAQQGPYSDCSDQVKIARIVELHDTVSDQAKKFYLQLISRKELTRRQEENRAIVARLKERRRIRESLSRMISEASERTLFSELARSNPEAAELLRKLDELG